MHIRVKEKKCFFFNNNFVVKKNFSRLTVSNFCSIFKQCSSFEEPLCPAVRLFVRSQ